MIFGGRLGLGKVVPVVPYWFSVWPAVPEAAEHLEVSLLPIISDSNYENTHTNMQM